MIDSKATSVYHIGRHFHGPGTLEENCPCPKEPCGFVNSHNTHPDCDQHPWNRAKTMRSGHKAENCEGKSE